ncbi:undecaprenyl-diphosphate phosphatase [Promethearchaeum syntrophicum]|uniref:Undecaprenyl-diphosphatase n=1 Tax=Promethearchaeum syntrophicum TaxID=2594042 RepID=A0A5B9DE97_9ARCH|nr:undecaprenyl-diphosphate phosphatase [Candidatus Prometheoarchaeum syntrophicum]QEE17345.1 undecaprenyl pyrophosphate phosphatase [Candidatus Prometheoarchaeum syntrophicum]
MNFFQKLILALLQAILEWLPVSSEGFLMLTAINIFGESADAAFSLAIYFHLGTALAVLAKYWRTYWDALVKDHDILRLLIISTISTGIIGIPLYLLLGEVFTEVTGMAITLIIGITLIITATLLRFGKLNASDKLEMKDRNLLDEFALGACQGFAILPGISRSGTTVSFLLLRGFKREDAFKMSFIISLPAVIGAILFDIIFGSGNTTTVLGWDYFALMLIVAVVAYFMMSGLLKFAKKLSFDKICYILGGITIILVILFYIFS